MVKDASPSRNSSCDSKGVATSTSRRAINYQAPGLPQPLAGYGGGGDRPLMPYAVLSSIWLSGLGGALGLARKMDKPLPRLDGADIILLGTATFQLSRLITKDTITSVFRAPFTRFKESGAPGETN